MAASTITRDTWTNDTGSAATPNADGTVLNNAALQNNIYARIDQMFAGTGAYATWTLGGKLAVEGFGSHNFSAGGTGANIIQVKNTTAGTANSAYVQVEADVADSLYLRAYSSTWSTTGPHVASGASLYNAVSGGISIGATHASGVIRFYTGGSTERMRILASGGVSIGDTSDPLAGGLRNTGGIEFGAGRFFSAFNGAEVGTTFSISGANIIGMASSANGTGATGGNGVVIGRNTSGGGAPGFLGMIDKAGNRFDLWTDSTGVVRTGTRPTETSGDTGGTVVGTQTSTRETKNIAGSFVDDTRALETILDTPLYRFTYKSGSYSGTEFVGIVADDSPDFAMDAGRSFNPVSAFGYTVAAFKALEARVRALEA
jgi:hypothetical protein